MKNMIIQRRLIGAIAFLLPFGLLLLVGQRPTISQTYHTTAQDIFTTAIVSSGVILLTYQGYDKIDNLFTNLAGAFGIILSLIPCAFISGQYYGFLQLSSNVSGVIHTTSAGLFFCTLGYINAFLFTKTTGETENKKKRNNVYRVCAAVLWGVNIPMLIISVFKIPVGNLFYWLEAMALWAFGVSWLVKGETILRDV